MYDFHPLSETEFRRMSVFELLTMFEPFDGLALDVGCRPAQPVLPGIGYDLPAPLYWLSGDGILSCILSID